MRRGVRPGCLAEALLAPPTRHGTRPGLRVGRQSRILRNSRICSRCNAQCISRRPAGRNRSARFDRLSGMVTTSTPFGRAIFAVGGNAESARRVGISINRTRIAAFSIVGLMAAIGGIVGASRYASVSFNAFAGGPLLLEAIGAAVIGGNVALRRKRKRLECDPGRAGYRLSRQRPGSFRRERGGQADVLRRHSASRRFDRRSIANQDRPNELTEDCEDADPRYRRSR